MRVAAYRQASADMTQKVESEGIVMLENKNQTLPLASGSKINLFGYGSRDTVYGGSGSGSGDSSNNITLEQGLTNAGFSVNPNWFLSITTILLSVSVSVSRQQL